MGLSPSTPSTAVTTGLNGNSGFPVAYATSDQMSAPRTFCSPGPVNIHDRSTVHKPVGFFNSPIQFRNKADPFDKPSPSTKVTFQHQPFKANDSFQPTATDVGVVKNDPHYKQFMNDYKNLMPRLNLREDNLSIDEVDGLEPNDKTNLISQSELGIDEVDGLEPNDKTNLISQLELGIDEVDGLEPNDKTNLIPQLELGIDEVDGLEPDDKTNLISQLELGKEKLSIDVVDGHEPNESSTMDNALMNKLSGELKNKTLEPSVTANSKSVLLDTETRMLENEQRGFDEVDCSRSGGLGSSEFGFESGPVEGESEFTSEDFKDANDISAFEHISNSKNGSTSGSIPNVLTTPITNSVHTNTPNVLAAASKANLVKLRKKTGYTFGNCKKALEANDNDLVKAEKWLELQAKELGWTKAMKIDGRSTLQGLVGIALDKQYAAMVEVNCETDFVAKNDKFQKLVDMVANTCLHHSKIENPSPNSLSKVFLEGVEVGKLSVPGDKENIADQVVKAIGFLGEKLMVRRAALVSAAAPTLLAALTHPSSSNKSSPILLGKYGAILSYTSAVADNNSANLAKQLCQHVIGMNPTQIAASVDDAAPKAPIVKEKPVIGDDEEKDEAEQLADKGEEDETVMMRQSFLLDSDRTVADVVAEGGVNIVDFVRFECGEAIEEQKVEEKTEAAQAGG